MHPRSPERLPDIHDPQGNISPKSHIPSPESVTTTEGEENGSRPNRTKQPSQIDPSSEFLPLHPLELRERVIELGRFLPNVMEPLRSAIQSSPFTPWLPANWFNVTTNQSYTETDREFTLKLYRYDPGLLQRFLEADINLLCLDRTITHQDIEKFYLEKNGLEVQDVLVILEEPSLKDLLDRIAYNVSRRPPGIALRLSPTNRDPNAPHVVSHIIPRQLHSTITRTDLLTNMQSGADQFPPAEMEDAAEFQQQQSPEVFEDPVPLVTMNNDMPETWTPPTPPNIPPPMSIERQREACPQVTAEDNPKRLQDMLTTVEVLQRYPEQSSPIPPGCIILTEDDDFLSEGYDM